MQLARQSRDDRYHVAFARTLVCRRTDFIGLPRHRSDYKDLDAAALCRRSNRGCGHSASSPAKAARGRVPIRRPTFPARRLIRGRCTKALFSILHDSHDREPSGVLSSVMVSQDSGGCLSGFGLRARLAGVLTGIPDAPQTRSPPPPWNWEQEPAILARGSEDDCERLHIERQGPVG